jgi:L,D-transpeptidase ErfK/SrfK
MNILTTALAIIITGLFSTIVYSETYLLENPSLIGKARIITPREGETLETLALRYNLSATEIKNANPQFLRDQPLSTLQKIILPTQFKLPKGPQTGIVINLATYRLFYFPNDENVVFTYPVGVGRAGWQTPLGNTKIIQKIKNPQWHPSVRLQRENAKNGIFIPNSMPANSANPLGKYALRLGWSSYLIHGTNNQTGVGEKVSAGCIRMLSQDIAYLFQHVKVGTTVRIVNEP